MRTQILHRSNIAARAFAALLLMTMSLPLWLPAPALATPLKNTQVTGVAKWKVPITIYIPRDPKPTGTIHDDIKKAVDEWAKIAANKNIKLTAVILDANGNVPGTTNPPDPTAKGNVVVTYQTQAGHADPQFEGVVVGKGVDGKDIFKDVEYTHGEIKIGTGAPAQAYVIALHEVGHILGLDHEAKGTDSIMQPSVDDYEKLTKPTASDAREFDSIYARSDARLDGSAFALGSDEFQYIYTATWLSGGEIPLVDIFVLGAPIENPLIPAGWEIVDFPFAEPHNFVSFRVSPTDELQAYLSSDLPVLSFSFISSEPPTTTFGWAGSEHPTQSVVGPILVPEPSALMLFVSGLIPLVFVMWVSRPTRRSTRTPASRVAITSTLRPNRSEE